MRRTRATAVGKDPMPGFVEPCLASLAESPPEGDIWAHEIKLDGYRVQAHIEGGKARILSRRGLDWTARFGHLAKAVAALPVTTALIDGEAIVEDERGVSSFAALVEELKTGRSRRIVLVAFDLLYLDGRLLMPLPLAERKAPLAHLLEGAERASLLRYSAHVIGHGRQMLAEACKLGLEGIVSKRLDRPYRSGRNDEWRKAKCVQSDEMVIAGYVDSTALKESIGSLVLGYYEAGKLIHAGRVGTGFDHRKAHELWQMLQPLKLRASPFALPLTSEQRKGVVYVEPRFVAQVGYQTWTTDRLLRHARFQALREDVPAASVRRPHVGEGGREGEGTR